MDRLWEIYNSDIPEFIKEFMNTSEMKRLQDVGMNCGCEYTDLKEFTLRHSYSRYDHSVGVALIVWHFTHDEKQAIAGLLHDISTPVFAHVIDFLNQDYLMQESTEDDTHDMIKNSKEINALLEKYDMKIEDVDNYHLYPIADNDAPKLSADRLEYTLGNMYNYGYCELDEIKEIYHNIGVGENENQEIELQFHNENIAFQFLKNAFKTFEIYVADSDRYSMQCLADIIRYAIKINVINKNDLYDIESNVIKKIEDNSDTNKLWQQYKNYSKIIVSHKEPEGYYVKVAAKKRYINPLVNGKRLTDINEDAEKMINDFKNKSFDYYMQAK